MKQSFTARESSSRGQALAILGLLLFCIPLIARGLGKAEFDGRPAALRDVSTDSGEHDLIVTWQGSRLNDPRVKAFREELLGKVATDGLLRGGSPYVADVVSADQLLTALTAAGMPAEQVSQSLAGIWLGRGGLKIRATNNGRRDLEWTARRIEAELNSVGDRKVRVVPRPVTTPVAVESANVLEIPEFDLEVYCCESNDPLAVPATLEKEVLGVRGYPTSGEPEGQRLVESAFMAIGTPVALRVELTDAGRAEPAAAGAAVRQAAIDAGIAPEDFLVTGSLLASAERSESLRAAAWPGSNGKGLFGGRLSPIVATFLAAGVLGVLVGGSSIDLIVSMALGALGGAALAAGINLLGIPWTESLLLIPAFVFILTISTTLLEPGAGASLSARVRKPMSASTLLCALCLVTLLVGSSMQRQGDRQFALAGAAACVIAWALSTICVPPVAGLLGGRPIRRATQGLDFAEWIVTHHRVTAAVAATLGVVTGIVLLQPSVQNWVAASEPRGAATAQFALEQSLAGTSDLRAEIHFDAERTQRLRFLERSAIVRAAVEKLRGCHAVTGAISLAEAAPDIPRPAEDAKVRERTRYISSSNRAADQLRGHNTAMGGGWWVEHGPQDAAGSLGETWVVKASIAELAVESPTALLANINNSIQDVLRFHAGVSHELTGHLVSAAERTSSPSRRPGVIGVLAALSLIIAAVGTGSLGRGLAVAGVVAVPGLTLLVVPGFHPGQFGAPEFFAIAVPLSLGVTSCIRLVNDLGEWVAATSTRHEAIAFALSGSASRSRQALVTLAAVLGGLSLLAPQLSAVAVRAGLWTTVWAATASLAIFPLLLSGRLGRLIVKDSDRSFDSTDELIVTAPIRLEPPIGAPHIELETVRRRVRNAG